MLKKIKEKIKNIPYLGDFLHKIYLTVFRNEGQVFTLSNGLKMKRFMLTFQPEYATSSYEKFITDALNKYLEPGQTFYDVGANAGYFSLIAAKIVGTGGRVIAFEPHPKTAKTIKAQFRLNHLDYCEVVEAAASDTNGTAEFSDDMASVMQHLVETNAGLANQLTSKKRVAVSTIRLADYAAKSGQRPDLIKMDIEGAEIAALEGSKALIRDANPILLVELHNRAIRERYLEMMDEFEYQTEFLDQHEGADRWFALSVKRHA